MASLPAIMEEGTTQILHCPSSSEFPYPRQQFAVSGSLSNLSYQQDTQPYLYIHTRVHLYMHPWEKFQETSYNLSAVNVPKPAA